LLCVHLVEHICPNTKMLGTLGMRQGVACIPRLRGTNRWITWRLRTAAALAERPVGCSPLPPAASSHAPPGTAELGVAPPPPAGEPPPPSTPPPIANAPPPAISSPTGQTQPPEGLTCGGFFFAIDPNIGLWNDRVNPNWRLTFSNPQTKEKQRLPYAFSIQQRGPHAELGVRFQFGFVYSTGSFAVVPQVFDVESGWEATMPLPLSCVRLSHTVIRSGSPQAESIPATVYCIDYAVGLSAGVQVAVSGKGVKGAPELSWRGDVAMAAFIIAVLGCVYTLIMLPSTWKEFIRELTMAFEDYDETQLAFETMDVDGDGYITREDVRAFMQNLPDSGLDPDVLFDALNSTGSGRVSFDEFVTFFEAAQQILRDGSSSPERAQVGSHIFKPFGGAFAPAPLQPFGGAFAPSPFSGGLPPALNFPPGPVGPGPRFG